MTTPATPPPSDAALDVAAVAAEARALLAPMRDRRECGSCGMVDPPTEEGGQFHIACPKAHPTMGTYAVETMHSLPTRDTLEPFCHAVVALAARVTAAEAAHAALAGAVREERALAAEYDAAWAAHIAGGAPLDAAEGVLAMCDRLDGVRAATDALLRGAPGGFVRASVVVEYLDADREWQRSRYMLAELIDAAAVERTERLRVVRETKRTALDAALAAVKETR